MATGGRWPSAPSGIVASCRRLKRSRSTSSDCRAAERASISPRLWGVKATNWAATSFTIRAAWAGSCQRWGSWRSRSPVPGRRSTIATRLGSLSRAGVRPPPLTKTRLLWARAWLWEGVRRKWCGSSPGPSRQSTWTWLGANRLLRSQRTPSPAITRGPSTAGVVAAWGPWRQPARVASSASNSSTTAALPSGAGKAAPRTRGQARKLDRDSAKEKSKNWP